MWLLLDYDRVRQGEMISRIEDGGQQALGVDQEEQLVHVDKAQIGLLLIGPGWQIETIDKLRRDGVTCPAVLVVPDITDEAYEWAQEFQCVDVARYPIEVDYLKRWAKPTMGQAKTPQTPKSATSSLEQILRTHAGYRPFEHRNGSRLLHGEQVDSIVPVRGRVITLHSVRGGVGKTVVASLLAQMLSRWNRSVVLVDFDPEGNMLALHRGRSAITTDDWVRMPMQMDERMVKSSLTQIQSVHLLPSGGAKGGVDKQTMQRIVSHLSPYFDVVLLDTATTHPHTDFALELAHQVIYLVTPEWVSLKRQMEGYEAVKAMKTKELVTVVINRIRRRLPEHTRTIRLIEEGRIPSDTVHMPEDKTLYRELISGKPLHGGRDVQDAIDQLGSALRFVPHQVERNHQKRRPLR